MRVNITTSLSHIRPETINHFILACSFIAAHFIRVAAFNPPSAWSTSIFPRYLSPRYRSCAALEARSVLYEDDYYEALGLGRSASSNDIRSAFRKMARTLHPDCFVEELRFNPSTQTSSELQAFLREHMVSCTGVFDRSELNKLAVKLNKDKGALPVALKERRENVTNRFAQINEAYTVLYDLKSRQMYDLSGDWGTGHSRKAPDESVNIPSSRPTSTENKRGRSRKEKAETNQEEERRQRERTAAIQRNAARELKQRENAQNGAKQGVQTLQERVRADVKAKQVRAEAIKRSARVQRENPTDSETREQKLKREHQFNWRLRQEQAEVLRREEVKRDKEEAIRQARAEQEANRRKKADQKMGEENIRGESSRVQGKGSTMSFQESVRAEAAKLAAEKRKEREAVYATEKVTKAKLDAEWRKEWDRKEAAEKNRRKEETDRNRLRAEKARADAVQKARLKTAQRYSTRQPPHPGTVQQRKQPDQGKGNFNNWIEEKKTEVEDQIEFTEGAGEPTRLEAEKREEILRAVQINAYELNKLDEEQEMTDDFLRSLME